MGKIIQLPHIQEKRLQSERNMSHLKALADKYIKKNKKFVLDKLKQEQNGK